MTDREIFVIVDADGDDRQLNNKADWPTEEAAHKAIDGWQQAGAVMSNMPWHVVKRTEVVLGSYRVEVAAKFVAGDASFAPTES